MRTFSHAIEFDWCTVLNSRFNNLMPNISPLHISLYSIIQSSKVTEQSMLSVCQSCSVISEMTKFLQFHRVASANQTKNPNSPRWEVSFLHTDLLRTAKFFVCGGQRGSVIPVMNRSKCRLPYNPASLRGTLARGHGRRLPEATGTPWWWFYVFGEELIWVCWCFAGNQGGAAARCRVRRRYGFFQLLDVGVYPTVEQERQYKIPCR